MGQFLEIYKSGSALNPNFPAYLNGLDLFPEEIICEKSTDWNMVKQYFKLRTDTYLENSETKLKGLLNQGAVDYDDYDADFFVLRKGEQCLGGSRLAICQANSNKKLPLEGNIFSLKELLPELKLEYENYGESGRTVVDQKFRDRKNTQKLFDLTVESAIFHHKCRYLFGVAPLSQAKLYKILYKKVGINAIIREDINLPQKKSDEGKRMYLMYADLLNSEYATKRSAKINSEA